MDDMNASGTNSALMNARSASGVGRKMWEWFQGLVRSVRLRSKPLETSTARRKNVKRSVRSVRLRTKPFVFNRFLFLHRFRTPIIKSNASLGK